MTEPILNLVELYWWQAMAIFGSPLVAVMLTQRVKQTHKRLVGRKPHWFALDMLSFSTCLGMAWFCWEKKYHDPEAAFVISTSVAILHSMIVKMLFRFVGKISPELAEEIENGVTIDHYDDRTVFNHTKTVILGKRGNEK